MKNRTECVVLSGDFEVWKNTDLSSVRESSRMIRKKSEDTAAITGYLEKIRNGEAAYEAGIVMRIPFADRKQYCIAGPLFAALLFREYKLAAGLIDRYHRVDMKGLLISPSFDGPSPDHFEPYIYIDQLFLADPGIPRKLIMELIHCDGFYYSAEHNVINNDLIAIIDSDFALPSLTDMTEACGKAPYQERFADFRKKCPEVFDELFLDILLSEDTWEQFYFCGRLNEVQDICRMVYKDHSGYSRAVLAFFNCETCAVSVAMNSGNTNGEGLKRYIADAKKEYGILREDAQYFPGFIRTIFAMVFMMKHHDRFLFCDACDGLADLFTKYTGSLQRILTKSIDGYGTDRISLDDLILAHERGDMLCPGIEMLFDRTFSVEKYLEYITCFTGFYKKYLHKEIHADDLDKTIAVFLRKLEALPMDELCAPQGAERTNRFSGKEEWDRMKVKHLNELYSLIDRYD